MIINILTDDPQYTRRLLNILKSIVPSARVNKIDRWEYENGTAPVLYPYDFFIQPDDTSRAYNFDDEEWEHDQSFEASLPQTIPYSEILPPDASEFYFKEANNYNTDKLWSKLEPQLRKIVKMNWKQIPAFKTIMSYCQTSMIPTPKHPENKAKIVQFRKFCYDNCPMKSYCKKHRFVSLGSSGPWFQWDIFRDELEQRLNIMKVLKE